MSSKSSSYRFPLYLQSPSYSISPWNQQVTNSYPANRKPEQFHCWAGARIYFFCAHSSQLQVSKPLTDNTPLLKGAVICRKEYLLLWWLSSPYFTFLHCKMDWFSPEKIQTFTKLFNWNLLALFPLWLYCNPVSFMRIFRGPLSPFSS